MRRARILCSVLFLSLAVALGVPLASPPVARAMDEADRLWMVGQQAFSDGLYPLSRRMLERLIDRYPSDRRIPDALLILGKTRFSQKAYPGALEAFRKAQGFTPVPGRPGEARFWEAETLFRIGRFADARTAYDSVLADA